MSQIKMKPRLIYKICPRQVFSYSWNGNNCSITYVFKECPPSSTCLSQYPSPWTAPLFYPLAQVRNLTASFLPTVLPVHAQSIIPGTSPLHPLFSISLAIESPLPALPLTGSVTTATVPVTFQKHERPPSFLLKTFLCLPLSIGTRPTAPSTTLKVLQFGAPISINLCLSFLQVLVFKQCQTLKISSYA